MSGSRITANPAAGEPVVPTSAAAPDEGFVGVLMLDTRFPRPPGDIGHPDSLGVPVRHAVIPGAWPRTVVGSAAALRASGLAHAFIAAARQLERQGARAITTSCGFLVLLQGELQAAVGIPVATSSLLHLPRLLESQAQVGVLTISADLGADHLLAAGVPAERLADVVVQCVDPDGEFAGAILDNRDTMDLANAQADVVAAAIALRARAPRLDSVVLECTNMPPHAPAVRAACGWRLYSLIDWFGDPRRAP